MDDFIELVKNKNVLLVGNGSSVLKHDYSKDIDSYEFVIRFNYGIREHRKYPNSGKKADAWFYTIWNPKKCIGVWKSLKHKPKHCIRHAGEPVNIGEHQYHIPTEFRNKLNASLNYPKGKLASTGLCAIHYLVEYCDTKSITLIGFDSFNTSNYYSHANTGRIRHLADVERAYINKLFKENKIKFLDR